MKRNVISLRRRPGLAPINYAGTRRQLTCASEESTLQITATMVHGTAVVVIIKLLHGANHGPLKYKGVHGLTMEA